MKKNLLFLYLLLMILLYPLSVLWQNHATYFTPGYHTRYEDLKKTYYSSQYADKNHTEFIPDQVLESFAGGIFLTGINPILIHHDQPPLGRYLISLSIWLFDNENTVPLLLLGVSVLGLYLVSFEVLRDKYLALIPVGLFINQLMFINKFTHMPLLEPIQFPFIIFALYTFIIGVKKKNYLPWFLLTAVLIGCIISIRFFILGAALASSLVFSLLFEKQFKKMIVFIASLSVSVLVLLASYFQTFQAGYSLIKVFGIQKYILVYRQSAFVEPFSYWDLLLFNRWHTWWGDYAIISDPEWNILWPISVGIIVIFMIFYIWKNLEMNHGALILMFWISFYSLMLSFGYSSTRYFLPLIPFLYILATCFSIKLIHYAYHHHQKKRLKKKK